MPKTLSVSPTHQKRIVFDYGGMPPPVASGTSKPVSKRQANPVLTAPKAGPQGPLIPAGGQRHNSVQKQSPAIALNEHIQQISKKMAASPSNAATDNYFKVFSKPKPSIAKNKIHDAGMADIHQGVIHDPRPRGGSVSKVESARVAEKHHKRRGTAGAGAPAAAWGLNLMSTQMTSDPK